VSAGTRTGSSDHSTTCPASTSSKKDDPQNLESLKTKDGKLAGLPYFTSLFTLIYNEPMLQQAGIKAPAKSWDELVEHSVKLKKDKVSDHPFLPNWNNSPSGTMPQFMTDAFSEGANVFDAKNKVIVDQEPAVARAMERWQKVWKAELVNPEVLTRDLVDRYAPLFWTGRYAYHTNHSSTSRRSPASPELETRAQEGEDDDVPRHRPTYMWTDSYTINAKTKNMDDAWADPLPGRQPRGRLVRPASVVPHLRPRQLSQMYEHPEIIASYDRWVDLKLLRKQYGRARSSPLTRSPGTASTTSRPCRSSTT
jgi:multiple sugar transport system substrate-binding protein